MLSLEFMKGFTKYFPDFIPCIFIPKQLRLLALIRRICPAIGPDPGPAPPLVNNALVPLFPFQQGQETIKFLFAHLLPQFFFRVKQQVYVGP